MTGPRPGHAGIIAGVLTGAWRPPSDSHGQRSFRMLCAKWTPAHGAISIVSGVLNRHRSRTRSNPRQFRQLKRAVGGRGRGGHQPLANVGKDVDTPEPTHPGIHPKQEYVTIPARPANCRGRNSKSVVGARRNTEEVRIAVEFLCRIGNEAGDLGATDPFAIDDDAIDRSKAMYGRDTANWCCWYRLEFPGTGYSLSERH